MQSEKNRPSLHDGTNNSLRFSGIVDNWLVHH